MQHGGERFLISLIFLEQSSERHDDIEDLLAVARLLDVADLAASAVGNPGLGNFFIADRICRVDVFRPDHAGELKLADLEVDPDFLPALEHQVAVGQHVRYQGRHLERDRLLAVDLTGALVAAVARHIQQADATRIR
jgi:hypothetical protein